MKLDCVLTAVNENKLYIEFIEFFIKTWNKLYPNVDVKIVLVAKKIPDEFSEYKNNIILFEPIDNISTSSISQIIRLFYPAILNYKNGVLITDIDMIPLNNKMYSENIINYTNDKFIYYLENTIFDMKQIAICYNVATPEVWKDIFNIKSLDDIKTYFIKLSKEKKNIEWNYDQKLLYLKVNEWNRKTNNFVCLKLKDVKYKRLNRHSFKTIDNTIKNNIINGVYTDYHCYRPMSNYSKINWEIYNIL